jgi:hypothetical protein
MIFQSDSTKPLDDCHFAGAATTLELLSMRYSLMAVPSDDANDDRGLGNRLGLDFEGKFHAPEQRQPIKK